MNRPIFQNNIKLWKVKLYKVLQITLYLFLLLGEVIKLTMKNKLTRFTNKPHIIFFLVCD